MIGAPAALFIDLDVTALENFAVEMPVDRLELFSATLPAEFSLPDSGG